MKFVLEIDLGSGAMHTPKHVEKALADLAKDIGWDGYGMPGDGGIVRDVNGNKCGKWEVREDAPEKAAGIDSTAAARHFLDYGDDPGHGAGSGCELCTLHLSAGASR